MYKGMVFGVIVAVTSLLSGCTAPVKAVNVKKLSEQIVETDNLDDWPEVPSIDAHHVKKAFLDFSMRYNRHKEKIESLSGLRKCNSSLSDLVNAGLFDKNSVRIYEIMEPSSVEVFSQKGCSFNVSVDMQIFTVLSFPTNGKSALSKVIYYREQLPKPINNYSFVF